MAVYAPCPDCSGNLIVGMTDPIRVPKLSEEGEVVIGRDGKVETIVLRLPRHVLPLGNGVVTSKFDETGLAPAPCRHGLAEHPDPDVMASPHSRQAVSWIRAKYLTIEKVHNGLPLPGCPVCWGREAPDDMLLAYDGTPVGETKLEQLARLQA